MVLTPDIVVPSVTHNAGMIGEGVDLNLIHRRDLRSATLVYHLTKTLLTGHPAGCRASASWAPAAAGPSQSLLTSIHTRMILRPLSGYERRRGPGTAMDIKQIVEGRRHDRVRITDHAGEEAQADRLSYDEIFDSVIHGRLIEDYPDDKPYPSCLVYGSTRRGEPVHSVWAYDSDTE